MWKNARTAAARRDTRFFPPARRGHSLIATSLLLWIGGAVWLLLATTVTPTYAGNEAVPQTCSWSDGSSGNVALDDSCQFRDLTVDFGPHRPPETFRAYVTPDVATFYNATPGSRKAKKPFFTGLFGKFVNLSPMVVRILWDPQTRGTPPSYITDIDAFESAGTATFPGHVFLVTPRDDESNILTKFQVRSDQSIYVYDPLGSLEAANATLTPDELELYQLQHDNLVFGKAYRQLTGREWIALYPRRHPPRYPLLPANFIGQTHTVQTKELPFLEHPPKEEQKLAQSMFMGMIVTEPNLDSQEEARRHLQKYRGLPDNPTATTWNMTVKVVSCAPRVYEIDNFLSPVEVEHLLHLATGMELSLSTTRAGHAGTARSDTSTRTSLNSWIARGRSLLVDAMYRRAADLLQIDEALLRNRKPDEIPDLVESKESIAERLQLVHYDVGQQYTAHHDFAIPSLIEGQPSRYATILFYLNDGMTGGETSFPRWLNAESSAALKVSPKVGKAVLFYSVLPDGNYDERSQHAALPVITGEKWLTNLWVWDPYLDYNV